jgi:hypothetical protein
LSGEDERVFLTLMVVGLVGLFMMALPAFGHHGHAHPGGGHAPGGHAALGHAHGGHALGHAHGGHAAPGHAHASPNASTDPKTALIPTEADSPHGLVRFLPTPRAIFTLLALFGAFGNALVRAAHLGTWAAALVAALLAFALERLVVRPLFNLVFRFQGKPSAPLTALLFSEATAVTPFRNGRGLVSVVREGRVVQLSAHLRSSDLGATVSVGDRLRIEDVDEARERVTVSTGDGNDAAPVP